MSNPISDGGPAFPIPLHPGQTYTAHALCDGMTLLDYFAAHAPEPPGDFMRTDAELYDSLAWRVRWRWAYADAMLRAREETK